MADDVYRFEKLIGVGNVELILDDSQRVYTFIGTNGVGKTKCLEALFQLHWFDLCFGNSSGGVQRLVFKQAQHNDLFIEATDHGVIFQNNLFHKPLVFIGVGSRGLFQKTNSANVAIGTFEQRRAQYVDHVLEKMRHDFPFLGSESRGLDSWFVTRAHSANPYQKQKDNRDVEIKELLKVLHDIDKRFDLEPIEITGDNKVELSINGERKKITELSSGFASLLKILQAIISGYANMTNETNITHVKGTVFIDEIENHLHSKWQVSIISLLKSSFPNTTFFITTHSPIVLTQLNEGEAYLLKRDEDGVVRSKIISSPSNRLLIDVIDDAFDIDLNQLKSDSMIEGSQSDAKKKLREFLDKQGAKHGE